MSAYLSILLASVALANVEIGEMEIGGSGSDSSCSADWYEAVNEITQFIDGHHHDPLEIIETHYPRLGQRRPPKECILGAVVVDLFVHLVNCRFMGGALAGDNPMHCGDSERPTIVDMNWIFDILLYGAWDMLIMSRWRIIFRLLALIQQYWPVRRLPEGCSALEDRLVQSMSSTNDLQAMAPFASAYLLDSATDSESGLHLQGWLGSSEGHTECSTHALAVAWLSLAGSNGDLGKRPITPCSGLHLAQTTIRFYHENATSGMWIDEMPGKKMMSSQWPIFALLDQTADACRDRPSVGNVDSSSTLDLTFILDGDGVELADAGETMGQLPQPFSPRFDVAARERFLQTHRALHDVFTLVGIPYTLLRGPLLGFLRHQAPLPWENDGDVCVPRARYDELLVLALANTANGQSCTHSDRCSQLAEAAASMLALRGVHILVAYNAYRGSPKFILYASEDADNLLSDKRGLHDPVIDIYLCDDWPAEGPWVNLSTTEDQQGKVQTFGEAGGVNFPIDWIFPLKRVFFGGLSMWAYRDSRHVLNQRYGTSWVEDCRLPFRLAVGGGDRLKVRNWPKYIPCHELDGYFARAVTLQAANVPNVEGFGRRLAAWLCVAFASSGRPCTPDFGGDARVDVDVPSASALLAPRRAVPADAHPVLQYLLDVDVRPSDGVLCEMVVRLVPLSASAPVLSGVNFDALWFAAPPMHRRVLVPLESIESSNTGLAEVFLEVFSCVCWQEPLEPISEPIWDLEAVPNRYSIEEAAAAAVRSVYDLTDPAS